MPDHFERLALPRRFSVDKGQIEREYLARSRTIHPDYHTQGSAAEQMASLEMTAALNEAYLTLNEPYRRAEYLLKLCGGPTSQQEKNLDQAFLMEMMEIRERIEGLQASANSEERDALDADLRERQSELLVRIAGEFERVEALPEGNPGRMPHLSIIRRLLNATKTIQSLLRDLHAE